MTRETRRELDLRDEAREGDANRIVKYANMRLFRIRRRWWPFHQDYYEAQHHPSLERGWGKRPAWALSDCILKVIQAQGRG